jgi:hypothetical protein
MTYRTHFMGMAMAHALRVTATGNTVRTIDDCRTIARNARLIAGAAWEELAAECPELTEAEVNRG